LLSFSFGCLPEGAPARKRPAAQPPDIPGWSALEAGVFC